jgi:hypothetical protein
MKAYGEVNVEIRAFLTSTLVEVSDRLLARAALTRGGDIPLLIGDLVGSRTCLDDEENRIFLALPELVLLPLRCSACKQLLYRLS